MLSILNVTIPPHGVSQKIVKLGTHYKSSICSRITMLNAVSYRLILDSRISGSPTYCLSANSYYSIKNASNFYFIKSYNDALSFLDSIGRRSEFFLGECLIGVFFIDSNISESWPDWNLFMFFLRSDVLSSACRDVKSTYLEFIPWSFSSSSS